MIKSSQNEVWSTYGKKFWKHEEWWMRIEKVNERLRSFAQEIDHY